ncbi:effector-associated constant component EACC1 [Nocardia sp. NPDC004722]
MTAQIRLVGGNAQRELTDLVAWLSREDDFRGRVSLERPPVQPGDMGAVTDVLVVAFGAQGLGAALAASLTVWIKHRRPSADIEVTRGAHRNVKISVTDLPASEVADLLRKALEG